MKKTLKVFLVSALLAVLLTFCASAKDFERTGTYGDNIRYEFDGEVLTLSGTGRMMNNYGDMEKIPWFAHTRKDEHEDVEKITLKKVIIEEGVTSVAEYLFYECPDLEEVVLPEGIISLDGGCFLGCTSLEKINFPTTLEYIGIYTFDTCKSLKEIELSGNIKEIGMFAFCNTGIKNIKIPASVEVISDLAFNFFNDDLSDKYTAVIENIFVDEENENYCDIDGVLFNKDKSKLIIYPHGNKRTSYIIPEGTEILSTSSYGLGAFYYSKNLETLVVPTSLKTIEGAVFYDCTSLKDVYYCGTEEEWNDIFIDYYNDNLLDATIHFKHIHRYKEEIITEATCKDEGEFLFVCECGDSYRKTVSITDHRDANNDKVCDICNEKLKVNKTLFEIILAFIYAVLNFFERVF